MAKSGLGARGRGCFVGSKTTGGSRLCPGECRCKSSSIAWLRTRLEQSGPDLGEAISWPRFGHVRSRRSHCRNWESQPASMLCARRRTAACGWEPATLACSAFRTGDSGTSEPRMDWEAIAFRSSWKAAARTCGWEPRAGSSGLKASGSKPPKRGTSVACMRTARGFCALAR